MAFVHIRAAGRRELFLASSSAMMVFKRESRRNAIFPIFTLVVVANETLDVIAWLNIVRRSSFIVHRSSFFLHHSLFLKGFELYVHQPTSVDETMRQVEDTAAHFAPLNTTPRLPVLKVRSAHSAQHAYNISR